MTGLPLAVVTRNRRRSMPADLRGAPRTTVPGTGSVGRVLLFAHLLLSPLVFWRGTVEAFEFNKVALLTLTAFFFCGLGLMSVAARGFPLERVARLVRQPLVSGVCLCIVSALLSTVFSVSPNISLWGAQESYAGFVTCLAYAVLFFATIFLLRNLDDMRRLTIAPIFGAAVASGYALLQVMHVDPLTWDRISNYQDYVRPFGTMGNPNFLAAYLAMSLPLVVHKTLQAIEGKKRFIASLLALIAVLAILVVVLTLSRGGWLAASAAVIVMIIGRRWSAGQRTVRKHLLLGSGAVAACAVALFVLCQFGVLRPLVERGSEFADSGGRPYIWKAALEIFRERPVFGSGVDTFQLAFPAHRDLGFWQSDWNMTPTKAHNETLHILATQGAVGGIAVAILFAGVAVTLIQLWRRGDQEQRPFQVAVAASLVAFFVQDLFSFTVAGCGTLFVTLAALLVRMQLPIDQGKRVGLTRRLWAHPTQIVAGVGTLAATLLFVVRPWQANEACARAETSLNADAATAVAYARNAVRLDSRCDYYWMRLGDAYQTLASQTAEKEMRQAFLRRACAAFEEAARLVPASAYHHANLGRVRGELAVDADATPEEVFDEFDAALRLDPKNVLYCADAGVAGIRMGDRSRAREYIERGLEYAPAFGPLLAERGYLAYAEERWADAVRFLEESLMANWYDQQGSRQRADWVLGIARAQFARQPKPSPKGPER
jgi:O-antigen ligase/Tfp pilus assembly protein PilF